MLLIQDVASVLTAVTKILTPSLGKFSMLRLLAPPRCTRLTPIPRPTFALTVFAQPDESTAPKAPTPSSTSATALGSTRSPSKPTILSTSVRPSFSNIFKKVTHRGRIRKSERHRLIQESAAFIGNAHESLGSWKP